MTRCTRARARHHARPHPARSRTALSAAVALLGLVLLAVAPSAGSAAGATARPDRSPRLAGVDTRIGAADCALLGRVYRGSSTDDDGTETAAGCDRHACLDGRYSHGRPDSETCFARGRPRAQEIFVGTCDALHRRWIAPVNRCAAHPGASRGPVVPDAPQCVAPFTTWVPLPGRNAGACLEPARVRELRRAVRHYHLSLARAVALTTPALCEERAGHDWRAGSCRSARAPRRMDRRAVYVVGDSITYRGTDELFRDHPDWDLDGRTGRSVNALGRTVEGYLAHHAMPGTVVMALGTNPSQTWTRGDYVRVTRMLSPRTRVVLVTPFRDAAVYGQQRQGITGRYAGWMKQIAHRRAHTCVVDWRHVAAKNRFLLVDGVHPTGFGEEVWAALVESAVKSCASR